MDHDLSRRVYQAVDDDVDVEFAAAVISIWRVGLALYSV